MTTHFYEASLEETTRQFKTCPATVQAFVDKERKEDKFVQRWWRDREMMRFAYAGKTNKEVGASLGITEQWVSTLIQRRLRESWALTKTFGDYPQYYAGKFVR